MSCAWTFAVLPALGCAGCPMVCLEFALVCSGRAAKPLLCLKCPRRAGWALPQQPDLATPAFYRGSPLKKCIVVKHLGREEAMADGTCSKSPPLKRLCQDVQVCSGGRRGRGLPLWAEPSESVGAKPLHCCSGGSCSLTLVFFSPCSVTLRAV